MNMVHCERMYGHYLYNVTHLAHQYTRESCVITFDYILPIAELSDTTGTDPDSDHEGDGG